MDGGLYNMSYVNTKNNLFPSSNVVYIDDDYLNLRKKGLLAYNNLEDAVNSWATGGEADLKFGTPSATKYGTISIGCGNFATILSTSSSDYVTISTEYLCIIGQGIDSTILSTRKSGLAYSPLIRVFVDNFIIKDLSIDSHYNSNVYNSLILRPKTTSNASVIENIKFFTSAAGSYDYYHIYVNGNFSGTIRNCIFDGTNLDSQFIYIDSGDFDGIITDCIFKNVSTNALVVIQVQGGVTMRGSISNCMFSGSPSEAFIRFTDSSYSGEINDCLFYSTRNGTCGISLYEVAANNGSEMFLTDSTFDMAGPCISGYMSNRTRIMDCFLKTYGGNQSCIFLSVGSFGQSESGAAGFSLFGSRVLGYGTGLAIYTTYTGNVTASFAGNYLRLPDGGSEGDSISANILNNLTNAFNAEIPSTISI